tara:strand:+ start:2054 stop:2503 length:450 start_codon:yes stop_codon:yes gene_type:complete
MSHKNESDFAKVREATRKLVREFDVFRNIRAVLDIGLSQSHALIEMEKHGSITVGELTKLLGLNKSSISRMLTKLKESGYITQIEQGEDNRVKPFALTPDGVRKLGKIDEHASARVDHALELLDKTERQKVIEGMDLYAKALRDMRSED